MVGAGFGPYAVMGYVISNMRPDKVVGFQVELNVKLLATTFGESEKTVQDAIDYLCAPDENTRTPGDDGRRLVKVGTFAYRVVNGAHYNAIRNEEERREQNRLAQERHRIKKNRRRNGMKKMDGSGPDAAEIHFVERVADGASESEQNDLVTRSLPEELQ